MVVENFVPKVSRSQTVPLSTHRHLSKGPLQIPDALQEKEGNWLRLENIEKMENVSEIKFKS